MINQLKAIIGFKEEEIIVPENGTKSDSSQKVDVDDDALKTRIEAYQKDKTKVSAFTLMTELTKLKKQPEYDWLNLSVAQSLQQSIVNMEKAFTRFFREKKGFPKFKSKHKSKQMVGFP
jgi:transposase